MQTDSGRIRRRPLRMRRSSRLACLVCYALAFGLPLLWEYAALSLLYPRKLAATAPDAAAHLLGAFPFLEGALADIAARTAEIAAPLYQVIWAREQFWLPFLGLCAAAAWALTLLVQLWWRFMHRSPLLAARQTARAIRSYRLTMLLVWTLNAAVAALVWFFGVRYIPGRTLWDYVVSFGIFALLPCAAALTSRLAASSAISGRHAFFKRL